MTSMQQEFNGETPLHLNKQSHPIPLNASVVQKHPGYEVPSNQPTFPDDDANGLCGGRWTGIEILCVSSKRMRDERRWWQSSGIWVKTHFRFVCIEPTGAQIICVPQHIHYLWAHWHWFHFCPDKLLCDAPLCILHGHWMSLSVILLIWNNIIFSPIILAETI